LHVMGIILALTAGILASQFVQSLPSIK
jgi:hypothetical protein